MGTKEREMILAVLARLSPCFDRAHPKPLAIEIKERIQAELPELNGDHLSDFLRWWCTRSDYLRAVAAEGSQRHCWAGLRSGDIHPHHRTYSANILAKREKPTG